MVNPAILMLLVVALFGWMAVRPKSTAPIKIFVLVAAVMAFGPLSEAVMNREAAGIPLKFDYHLQAIDNALGITAFWITRHLSERLRDILFVVYQTLDYWMILWFAIDLHRKQGRPRQMVLAYSIAYGLAPLFYLIVPGCGPRHAFPTLFPMGNPDVSPIRVALHYWPNAIPSLHVASAILLVYFAGSSRLMRAFAWIYLAGTVAATLAFEHYLIDLVVAVPYAWFAIRAGEGQYRRALTSAAFVLLWLVAIRFATPALIRYPLALQIAAVATIAAAAPWSRLRQFLASRRQTPIELEGESIAAKAAVSRH